jgi:hypothetical protein
VTLARLKTPHPNHGRTPNPRLDLSGARTASARATVGAVATDKESTFLCNGPVARRSTAGRWADRHKDRRLR